MLNIARLGRLSLTFSRINHYKITSSMSTISHGQEEKTRQEPAAFNELLKPFNLFNWRPNTQLSADSNYIEMLMLLTSNSICMSGHMACIIVDPRKIKSSASIGVEESNLYGAIVSVATNQPLYSELDSDVHAEIGALGVACGRGNATKGCTAYITMPPCKRCFAALLCSGITRIVSRRTAADTILSVAKKHGIEMVVLAETPEQIIRVNALTQTGEHEGERTVERQEEILEQRKRRKELQRKKKEEKKKRQTEDPAFQKKRPWSAS